MIFFFCVSLPPSGQSSTCLLCVCVLLQQQYGYQEEEERSLNSLDDNRALPFHPSSYRSRSRGSPLDRDRQLLQDLVSFYLTSPSSSSSSSSSPVQSLPRHRGVAAAAAAAAGLPSSLSSSSSSSFFPELDFPLDYGEDYVSQVAQQEPAEKKAQDEYDALSELDGERDEKRRQVTISFVHRVYFFCIPFLNIVCVFLLTFYSFFSFFREMFVNFYNFFSFLIHSLGYPYSCSIPPTLYPVQSLSQLLLGERQDTSCTDHVAVSGLSII